MNDNVVSVEDRTLAKLGMSFGTNDAELTTRSADWSLQPRRESSKLGSAALNDGETTGCQKAVGLREDSTKA